MPHKEYPPDPDTPINIPKTAKKEAVGGLVKALLVVAFAGLAALATIWGDGRYTLRSEMAIANAVTGQKLDDEKKQREQSIKDLQEVMDLVRKNQEEQKEDLKFIIYILQHEGKLSLSDMKGKLSPP